MSIIYRADQTNRLTTEQVDANFKFVGEVDKNIKSGILYFHKPTGRVHGSAAAPITTNLLISLGTPEEDNEPVEGGQIEVIFSGSVNPNIEGVAAADILNVGETITTQGLYSIFMTFTGGKYKVNIQRPVAYVGDGDALQDPEVPPPAVNVPDAPIDLVLTEGTVAINTPDAPTTLNLVEGTV